MIMFFICAFIAAAVGYLFIRGRRDRRENAEMFTGTVIGVEEKLVKRGHVFYKVVKPTVKYNNGKRDIVAEHHEFIRETEFRYKNGDEVVIRAYHRIPKIFYFAEYDNKPSYEAIICFVTAGAFFVIGIISEILFG